LEKTVNVLDYAEKLSDSLMWKGEGIKIKTFVANTLFFDCKTHKTNVTNRISVKMILR